MENDKKLEEVRDAFNNAFVSRTELPKILEAINSRFESLEEKMMGGFSDMATRFDQVFGELKAIREDMILHRNRIERLESTPTVSRELEKLPK